MKIRKPAGIDLGTTNSVIALLDPTDSTILTGRDEQDRPLFPSLVGYHEAEARTVAGPDAARLRGHAARPVASVKRFMGLDRPFQVGPERLTPPQVSAHILGRLRQALARTLADPRYLLDAAVITMPAYFNHNQIEATRQAGELAGYEVVELLHEPTAAAIYYSWVENHDQATYLVYDLGGGTFDVSVIRKRYGDYEVLSVSGDPFLGGDDFDRLLASHLAETGRFRTDSGTPLDPRGLDLGPGGSNFERLTWAAQGLKVALSAEERVRRRLDGWLRDEKGAEITLEAEIDRAAFNRLIRDKVDRTIDCCHEALRRARDRAGIRLGDIDYVVLVGGSSKIPLVRDTVRAAFCKPGAGREHARCPEPLLHEPDLCVAYGAALRAATHGTRYLDLPGELEIHLTSPPCTRQASYSLTGLVGGPGAADVIDGGSVRIQSRLTGLVEEAFLDNRGGFEQAVELRAEADNALELTVCDPVGRDLARLAWCVRHRQDGRPLGQGVLPTQLITRPLQIQVLSRARQRVQQVIAPLGACLPGTFACTCRTVDQSGQIVVPIFEENRLIKQLVIDRVDPDLPLGSPVDVEFRIDVKHNIEVRVKVRPGGSGEGSVTTAAIEAPPPPRRPTRAEIEEVEREIGGLLREWSGSYRTRVAAQSRRLLQDLNEALSYEDEPRAIQRMAELRGLLEQLQAKRGQVLDPPWPRFAQLVKQCLHQSATVADRTGRRREELFEQVYAQERYAEQAYEEKNQTLYRECCENLSRFAGYLERLLHDALPQFRRPALSPEEDARAEVDRYKGYLAAVADRVRARGRPELAERLARLAQQEPVLEQRVKADPLGALREARRLITEIAKVEEELTGARRDAARPDAGLLGQ
jgi:molecular chaperone DnaK